MSAIGFGLDSAVLPWAKPVWKIDRSVTRGLKILKTADKLIA